MKKSSTPEEDVVYVDEDGNPIEYEEGVEYVEEEVERGPGGLSLALNRFFHHVDRGGSLGAEIVAGIGMALLATCAVFLNMQLIGNMLTADVELVNSPQSAENIAAAMTYAQLYAGSVLVSILGTLVVGLVANLPLVQVSSMGLAGALLCLVETGSGLTYENLLFVNLIAGVAYAVVVLVPGVRTFVFDAVPAPVRKGLPAAAGLVLAWSALRVSGLLGAADVSLGGGKVLAGATAGSVSLEGTGLAVVVGVVVAVALFVALRVTHKGKPTVVALLGGTIAYLLVSIALAGIDTASTDSVANFGRVWLVAGSQASASTPFADSYLTYVGSALAAVFAGVGDVISAGADFSAYSGNAVALVVSGVLCYLFGGLFTAEGTLVAVADEAGLADVAESEAGLRAATATNAVTNVVAPLLGVGGVTVSPLSFGAASDRARSGLSSVVAAVLMVISLFVLVWPALFATTTYPVTSMMQWNYFAYGNGGFVYLVREVTFAVADVVMACVGVAMALSLRRLSGVTELVPAVVMAVVSVATLNIVAGVAAGLLVYLVIALATHTTDVKSAVPAIVLDVVLVVAVVLL